MTLKRITAPDTEPITLAEAKKHLRVEHDVDDTLIGALIAAAREQAEHELGRALVTQTWSRVLDAFPVAEIPLGMPPVRSVASIVYIDPDGAETTLPADQYALDATTSPGWVLPAADSAWPATMDTANAVEIRFVCGYGSAADVPQAIRQWMLLQIGAMYRHREAVGPANAELAGRFVDRLLDPYRVYA